MINRLNRVSPTGPATGKPKTEGASPAGRAPKITTGHPAQSPEQVALSSNAKMAQQIIQAAQDSTGVNGELVHAIRSALENGQYKPSSTAIAKAVAEVAWLVGK